MKKKSKLIIILVIAVIFRTFASFLFIGLIFAAGYGVETYYHNNTVYGKIRDFLIIDFAVPFAKIEFL